MRSKHENTCYVLEDEKGLYESSKTMIPMAFMNVKMGILIDPTKNGE
jgi:hypothetical protein